MRKFGIRTVIVALLAAPLTLIAAPAHAAVGICGGAATTTWTGASDQDWANAANWTNGVPTSNSLVCVPVAANHARITSGAVEVNQLEVTGGLEVISPGSLTLDGPSEIAALNAAGTITIAGLPTNTLTITTNVDMTAANFQGVGSLVVDGSANFIDSTADVVNVPFRNTGSVSWSDGNIDFGTHTVRNEGTWNIQANGDTLTADEFDNRNLVGGSSASTTIDANFSNHGTVNFTGSFTLNGGSNAFTNYGTANLGSSTLNYPTGFFSQDASAISATLLSGGTMTFRSVVIGGGVMHDLSLNNNADWIISNVGRLEVGGQGNIGQMGINGSLDQIGGTIAFEANSLTPGTGYDIITGVSTCRFDHAHFDITTPGFDPADLDAFDLIACGSNHYAFPYVTDDLAGNGVYGMSYDGTHIIATANLTGTVTGTVYVDTNGNGVKDAGETTGAAGVTVYADTDYDAAKGASEQSVVTDASGNYTFVLPAGSTHLEIENPNGFALTSAEVPVTFVPAGTTTSNVNFGVFKRGSISGMVFDDANGNGTKDSGETNGVSGVNVYLDTDNNGARGAGEPYVTTTSNGVFSFPNLDAGTYKVRAQLPAGVGQTSVNPSDIVIGSGSDSTTNIGVDVRGTIGGSVFVDQNGNGVRNPGEVTGHGGVTVFVDLDHDGVFDNGEPFAVSANDGSYRIVGLSAGTYDVDIVGSGNYGRTNDAVKGIVVPVNTDVNNVDFGVLPIQDDPVSNGTGYWQVGADGSIYSFGEAKNLGAPADLGHLNAPIVGITPTPSGDGYLVAGSDGGVFAYGDAKFRGSMGGQHLNKPIVNIMSTPTGDGYWLVASDGGVFAYGDAKFFGSMGGSPLNKPINGMTFTPSGMGYWLVASDGGIFAYGDAKFLGSLGSYRLNKPIIGMATTAAGNGYWLVGSDGGVFAYGDAPFLGSTGSIKLNAPITAVHSVVNGTGYWLIAADGGVFAYGDAKFLGRPDKVSAPITG